MATNDLIGQTINQYRIVELLGKGGMASVYRAHQSTMDRDVAIKIISPELAELQDFTARFEREAKMLASLKHLHILKVFDYGKHDNFYYLVMEMLSGGNLGDLITNGPLPLDLAVKLFSQIGSALDYAHRQGIIHRDLKPGNVLLDEEKNAYLTDFGLAKLVEGGPKLTQTGVAMGTPAYMSPEQWQGGAIDARADIYSLGIILYEMISGKLPFNGDTPFRLMHMHIYESHPALLDTNPDIPHAVDLVIARALAKNLDDRYSSAGEMVTALQEAVSSYPGHHFANVSTSSPGKITLLPLSNEGSQPPSLPVAKVNTTSAPSIPAQPVSGVNILETPTKSSAFPIVIGAVAVVILIAILFAIRQNNEVVAMMGTQTTVAQTFATLTAMPTLPPTVDVLLIQPTNGPGNGNLGGPNGDPGNGGPGFDPSQDNNNDPAFHPPTGPIKPGTFIASPRFAANIYAGPGKSSKTIRPMKADEKFTILGGFIVPSDPGPWFLIKIDDQTQGWVFSREIFVFPPGTAIPMITLTPTK